jgi:hypothetical protein
MDQAGKLDGLDQWGIIRLHISMPVENGGYKIVWNIESWKNIRYIMLWEEKIQIQQITDRQ